MARAVREGKRDSGLAAAVSRHLVEAAHLIGPTGRLAMRPLLPEGRERWQIQLLEGRRETASGAPAGV